MYTDNGAVMLSGSVRLVLWLTMANGPSTDNAESGAARTREHRPNRTARSNALELVMVTGRVVVR